MDIPCHGGEAYDTLMRLGVMVTVVYSKNL